MQMVSQDLLTPLKRLVAALEECELVTLAECSICLSSAPRDTEGELADDLCHTTDCEFACAQSAIFSAERPS